MAKLSDLTISMHAIQDGEWVRVDEAEFGDLEILARGFSDEFIDAQRASEARLLRKYGTVTAIPNAVQRVANAELLRGYLIVDVRNLEHDDGTPVTVQEFHAMLDHPKYTRLSDASWRAARRNTVQIADELEIAVGNSPRRSKLSSNGEARAPD